MRLPSGPLSLPLPKKQPSSSAPADWRRHFFCEHVDLAPTLTWEGIRGDRYVYARYFDQSPPHEFLHDLKADPDQLKNFAADPAHGHELGILLVELGVLITVSGTMVTLFYCFVERGR